MSRARRWIALTTVTGALLLAAAITIGALALQRLGDARTELADHLDPQLTQARNLTDALRGQWSAISDYLRTGRADLVSQYQQAKRAQEDAVTQLRAHGIGGSAPDRDLNDVLTAARTWQQTADGWTAAAPAASAIAAGQGQFDAVQAALARLHTDLDQDRLSAQNRLSGASTLLTALLATVALLLVALFLVLYLGFHRTVIPALTADTEATRRRLADEITELHQARELLDKRTRELERSNTDLEQFAYVAAHDLQEPLRKVVSFCQLLQRRYQGRLDERGDQFIAFAIDGAKRMQVLINDLLAFSQIGHDAEDPQVVDTEEVLAAALANLESAIAYTKATITHGTLPKVHGEPTLLAAVFQNLISNAIKFRAADPPEVRIEAVRDGDNWQFSITDNGIGIDPEHAERIFVLFQRLHTRSAYPGTGIGLAICRKIIDYHNGRIWLDTATSPGQTRFFFTVPAPTEPETKPTGRGRHSGSHPAAGSPATHPAPQS